MADVKAVLVEVPEALVEERRRTGADRWDELWEGELHMVPPPSWLHQHLGTKLVRELDPLAEARDLVGAYETGLYRPGTDLDYRVADHLYARPELATERAWTGRPRWWWSFAPPVTRPTTSSPSTPTLGVGEVIVVHPAERTVELFVLRGGRHILVEADAKGLDDRLHHSQQPQPMALLIAAADGLLSHPRVGHK